MSELEIIAARVPKPLVAKLRLAAAIEGVTVSALIVDGVRTVVDRFEADPAAAIEAEIHERLDRLEASYAPA
jgi:hypothetical protein